MRLSSAADPAGYVHEKVYPGTDEPYRSVTVVQHVETGLWYAIMWSRSPNPPTTSVCNAASRLGVLDWPRLVLRTSFTHIQ